MVGIAKVGREAGYEKAYHHQGLPAAPHHVIVFILIRKRAAMGRQLARLRLIETRISACDLKDTRAGVTSTSKRHFTKHVI